MLSAISDRRSIRRYKDTPVAKQLIEEILQAGILAPSSKNRQPWRFIVVTGNAKDEMIQVIEKGFKRERLDPLLPQSGQYLRGAEHTLSIMKQAPVTIFIVNPLGLSISDPVTLEQRIYEICNAQSIGAAIQNMTLTATELGLGSLWICDTYFAYKELLSWLNTDGELFAALSVGYADENPQSRGRKGIAEVAQWRD